MLLQLGVCAVFLSHCYITGGSNGLGLAIAMELSKRGAHITIVARDSQKLSEAIDTIKNVAKYPDAQKFSFISANVTDAKAGQVAFESANSSPEIGPVDWVFTCAGAAIPGFFKDQIANDFERGIALNYLGTLYTLKAAVKCWKGANGHISKKKIVIISSTLALTGLVGYSQYVPSKYATKGLAEVLRQELAQDGVEVHIYFVSTILSPGYAQEQLTKPEITKAIEGSTTGEEDASPENRAKTLLHGIINENRFMIASDWSTYALMLASAGTAPRRLFGELIFVSPVAMLFVATWRYYCDWLITRA
ncbi:3-ketosphinganine reductase [Mitosporidium daphniae]|uniref:3-dehydrosphinganine reductase n=1 Tax=Mitosporidium daphniae TaxID=1485682 RepID=A0A098VND6_9MICR|nr:3-ketosphinganine reductase [Mitosporidium daphniae]KGG50299.1 3-ketosphinganine reductase [Mitosporidium daphniae]|eukprot:XP_013236742.1 3-ketosphinganine reductase [Mitosporidium daphniae]